MGWNMRGLFAILTSITFAAGCAGKNSCVPGQSVACSCASGDTGAQVCENGGTYGACDCSGRVSVGGNGGGGNDMAGGGGGGGGGGGVTAGQKRLFITSTAYAGTVAASVCDNVAKSVNLTGTWKAWVSYTSVSTFDAIDVIEGTGPWVLLDGTVAFANHAQLATAPSVLIDISETGQKLPGPLSVWTGTLTGGVHSGDDCNNWSSSTLVGSVGETSSTASWTSNGNRQTCTNIAHVYCFEQ
jgi:hypothetical protein